MYYSVLNALKLHVPDMDRFRSEFDPSAAVIAPHITLVFPISAKEVSLHELTDHVSQIARATKRFSAHMCETQLSWDNYLYLTPRVGKIELVNLHAALYGGMLSHYLRHDLTFVPHITLAHFAAPSAHYSLDAPQASHLDSDRYANAQKKVQTMDLDFTYEVAEIQLIEVNARVTKLKTLATFALTG